MKKIFFATTAILTAVLLALTVSCQRQSGTAHQDYLARMEDNGGALKPFMTLPEGISAQEKEALEFLYAYMPLADVTDYPSDFYLQNVRVAFQAREEMGWNVPEREFRHFVLPLRVNNENLDSARTVFYRELKPRVQGLSMADAILEVNHWCHEKVTYQPSDGRTSSPLNLVKNALGRCGEQSTFCVSALRSVGIPARQVYTPRWAHTDDNHAWVEAWADGQWHFLGACEPEPVLDLGWFNAPASRAMLMHTKVFGKYDGPEEVVLESPNFTEVNLIDNYAKTARIDFTVVSADGVPVEGARVDFCIYNYAEFYPAVTKYTDKAGRTFSSAGLGDMLIWASKDGAYGYVRASFGKDKELTITLDSPFGSEAFAIVPPPEDVVLPEVTPELRARNDVLFAREDSLRHAYEATFLTREQALAYAEEQGFGYHMAFPLVRSRGNWGTLEAFMVSSGNHERIEQVLSSLSTKDLHDVTLENLQDYYSAPQFLGARVENEFLTPFYGYFAAHFKEEISTPAQLVQWVRDNITVQDNPKAWRIPMSPRGVYESREADPRSLGIFFVDLARALGMEARKDPVTGKIQYKEDGQWLDVSLTGETQEAVVAPKGTLQLDYTQQGTIDNPKYYSHFSISRIEGGRPHLMAFDEGEVDMGGGVDWAHVFKAGFPMDAGDYVLVSGNRLSDGSVPVSMRFFTVREGEVTRIPLTIDEGTGSVPVRGSLDAEIPFTGADGTVQSLLSATGRGFSVVAVLDPGKEPTNHALRDLAAARERLEAWGRPIVLLCTDAAALERLQKETAEGRYGTLPSTVILGLDTHGIRRAIVADQKLSGEGRLPLVVVADSFNRVFFCSEGYTIGLGDQLATLTGRL